MRTYGTDAQRVWLLVLFVLLVRSNAAAQIHSPQLTPDNVVAYYQNLRSGNLRAATEIFGDSARSHKCGFDRTAQLLSRIKNFTALQKQQLFSILQQTTLQCDTVIGHFHFYYDTAGTNTPALLDANNNRIEGTAKEYVDSAGSIFNHVWNVEIDQLGFEAPPFEAGQSAYPVYIVDMAGPDSPDTQLDYGITIPLEQVPNDSLTYYTELYIDNDFCDAGYSTKGIPALQVTAAHEFHHAIQLGAYVCRVLPDGYIDESYFYEMTSTWMESYVYPSVHDYYQYVDYFFSNYNGVSLYANGDGGYERVVWMQFLAKRFGTEMVRAIWNHLPTERFIESLRDAIAEHGSMLSDEFAQFAYWNYFTADRADTSKSYFNGTNYPRFVPSRIVSYANPLTIFSAAPPLSFSMYNFVINNGDTLTSVTANVDLPAALRRDATSQSISVELSANAIQPPYQILSNGLYAGYAADRTDVWRTFYLQSATHADIPNVNLAALPNPLNMNEANRLVLPVPNEADAVATVSFVSSSLHAAFRQQFSTNMEFGKRSIAIPTSLLKSKLSSGIFFVIATVNGHEYRWKVAVIK